MMPWCISELLLPQLATHCQGREVLTVFYSPFWSPRYLVKSSALGSLGDFGANGTVAGMLETTVSAGFIQDLREKLLAELSFKVCFLHLIPKAPSQDIFWMAAGPAGCENEGRLGNTGGLTPAAAGRRYLANPARFPTLSGSEIGSAKFRAPLISSCSSLAIFALFVLVEMFREILTMHATELAVEEAMAREFHLLEERSSIVMYSAAFLHQPYIDQKRIAEVMAVLKT